MQEFKQFVILGRTILNQELIQFSYRFDDEEIFEEQIRFPGVDLYAFTADEIKPYADALSIALGVSYYKLYPTREILVQDTSLSDDQIFAWKSVYHKWLGEFYYRNDLDPWTLETIRSQDPNNSLPDNSIFEDKTLMMRWWGKDSITSYELYKARNTDQLDRIDSTFLEQIDPKILEDRYREITLFSVWRDFPIHHNTAQVAWAERLLIQRTLPLTQLNQWIANWYYNGHVPITLSLIFIAALAAKLYSYKEIVVSSEQSADEWNLTWKWLEVNHQWSKSKESITLIQDYVKHYINPNLQVSDPLGWLLEAEITQQFANYTQYFSSFSSCNRNFHVKDQSPDWRWCKKCPKCLFTYIMLRPHINAEQVQEIRWEELYNREDLLPLAKELRGFEGFKPFECVGTPSETRQMTNLFIEKNNDIAKEFVLTQYFLDENNDSKSQKKKELPPL